MWDHDSLDIQKPPGMVVLEELQQQETKWTILLFLIPALGAPTPLINSTPCTIYL
jgi:hypothetical protein